MVGKKSTSMRSIADRTAKGKQPSGEDDAGPSHDTPTAQLTEEQPDGESAPTVSETVRPNPSTGTQDDPEDPDDDGDSSDPDDASEDDPSHNSRHDATRRRRKNNRAATMDDIMALIQTIATAKQQQAPRGPSYKNDKPPTYNCRTLKADWPPADIEDWITAVEAGNEYRPGAPPGQLINWALTKVDPSLQTQWRQHSVRLVADRGDKVPTWDEFLSYIRQEHIAPEQRLHQLREDLFNTFQRKDEDPIQLWTRWDSLQRAVGNSPEKNSAFAWDFWRRLQKDLRETLQKQRQKLEDPYDVAVCAQVQWRMLSSKGGREKRSYSNAFESRSQGGRRKKGAENRGDSPTASDRSSHPKGRGGRRGGGRGGGSRGEGSKDSRPDRNSSGAQPASKNHSGNPRNSDIRCYTCNELGHKANDPSCKKFQATQVKLQTASIQSISALQADLQNRAQRLPISSSDSEN
jgi:hypothetical protein